MDVGQLVRPRWRFGRRLSHPAMPPGTSNQQYKYRAFVSYSHQSDRSFAPALQRVLERIAKPWYRRRAIDLFRDQTDLAVNPGLWPRIVDALDNSEHLLLLGSPSAAQSHWVAREIEHWRSNHDSAKLVVALTDGDIVWDEAASDFDWSLTTAIPRSLAGAFASEPLWADFRDARTAIKDAGAFREPAIRLVAALRGMPPRDLDSEDLRQHRRTLRLAGAGLVTLLVLTLAAVFASLQAIRQRDLARSRELAALSAAQLTVDPDLSVLLALRASEVVPTPQAERALRAALPLSHARRSFRADGLYLNSLSFSSDGKRMVTSSGWSFLGKGFDLKARIWNVETGQVLATLNGHAAPVLHSSFSPDGRLVLTVGREPIARVWEAATGKPVAELNHHASVNSASLSFDGKSVVTAGNDGVALVWGITSSAAPVAFKHPDSVNDAEFSPDGASIVTATGKWRLLDSVANGLLSDKRSRFTVSVWDVHTARERLRLPPFEAPVSTARFSPDGTSIVTVSGDNLACLWDARDGRRTAELRGHTASIADVAFSADRRWIATASSDTTARVWDAHTGALRVELRGHKQPLHSIKINADGRLVVTAGGDHYAVVWDVATGRALGELRGHEQSITGLELSPDERSVGTTSHDGTVRLWRIPPGGIVDPIGPLGAVEKMALSTDGERILVENTDRQVTVWARRTGTRLASLGPAPVFTRPAWSADGRRVIVPVSTESALVYDAGNGALIKELGGQKTDFRAAALSPDGSRIAAFEASTHTLAIWQVASGHLLARTLIDISLDEGSLEFSADGSRLLMVQFAAGGSQLRDAATGASIATFAGRKVRFSPSGRRILEIDGKDSVPHVYDAGSGRQLSMLGHGSPFGVTDAAFGPGERQVLTVDTFGTALLWDLEERRVASEFKLKMSILGRLVVSPDGRMITATGERTVEVWDLQSKKKIVDLRGHSEEVKAAAFTPDGLSLVTGSSDGTVRVYPAEAFLPLEEVVARARATVSRKLSEFELRDPFQ